MQAHAILRPARVDGWTDPDPMATLWPGEPGEPVWPAEATNRVCFIVFLIQSLRAFRRTHLGGLVIKMARDPKAKNQ